MDTNQSCEDNIGISNDNNNNARNKNGVNNNDNRRSSNDNNVDNNNIIQQCRKIFVGGLPTDIQEKDFHDHFVRFGAITDSVIIRDRKLGASKGFGFITYESHEAAGQVLKSRYHMLNNKQVEVKIAVPKEHIRSDLRNHSIPLMFDPPCLSLSCPYVVSYDNYFHVVPCSNYEAHVYGQFQVTPACFGLYNNLEASVCTLYQIPSYSECAMSGGSMYNGCSTLYYNGSFVPIGGGANEGYGSYVYGTGYYDISRAW